VTWQRKKDNDNESSIIEDRPKVATTKRELLEDSRFCKKEAEDVDF
jgi:hypothetical protein